MAIRIIKQDSSEASKIQAYSFLDDPGGMEPELEDQDVRTEALGFQRALALPAKRDQQPPAPAVDLAQVEKVAYENGFRQGEKAGMEIAERKVEALMRRYADAVLEVGRLKPTLYAEVEREVVKLAIEIAKKLVYREIQADRQIIQALVKVALSHVAEKSAVTVHLNPIDYNYVLEHRAELSQDDNGCEVVLLADKAIERGGCLVQTECGDIDARIEERFREVERGFFEESK